MDFSNALVRRIADVSALLAVLIGGLSGVLFLAVGGFRPERLDKSDHRADGRVDQPMRPRQASCSSGWSPHIHL